MIPRATLRTARGAALRAVLAGLLGALMAGCVQQHAAPTPAPPPTVPTAIPPYDPALPPARAALVLAPGEATTLRVVDWSVVRRQVGLPELTSRSSAADRAAFRVRSAVEAPPVVLPLLERADARLRSGFGFGADDVAWEAHWSGAGAPGWALSFGPGVDMAAVRRAVRAGLGPLRGAVVDPADRLVASALPTRGPVWGSDPRWARLVPAGGEAFVLRRECLSPADLPGPARAAERSLALLQPLVGFAVTFGDHVATVRVDRGRTDLFARVGAARRWPVGGAGDPTFGGVFRHGVADPSSGRIGYDVPRPRAAAALVRRDLLPFGVCAPPA